MAEVSHQRMNLVSRERYLSLAFTDENTRTSENSESIVTVTDAINQGVESPEEYT